METCPFLPVLVGSFLLKSENGSACPGFVATSLTSHTLLVTAAHGCDLHDVFCVQHVHLHCRCDIILFHMVSFVSASQRC